MPFSYRIPESVFSPNQVEGEEIVIRNATKGEKIVLLDDNDLELSTDDLVIADIEEPMCLAGIRGGKKDSVLDSTESIVLEIANFSPNTIRKTEQRFGEKTDSGIRYEKGMIWLSCSKHYIICYINYCIFGINSYAF